MGSEQRNALFALVLSGLILFGWQFYFAPTKPVSAPIEPTTISKTEQPTQGSTLETGTKSDGPIEPAFVETFSIRGSGVEVTFDSTLAVKNFDNSRAALNFDDAVGSKQPMKILFDFGNGFQTVNFTKGAEENTFENSDLGLIAKPHINEKGVVTFNITSKKPFSYRFDYQSSAKKLENGQERVFAFYTDELNRYQVGEDEPEEDRAIKWAGIDFNYHLFGLYFDKAPALLHTNKPDGIFSIHTKKAVNSLEYNLVFVKKEYNELSDLGHNLKNSVDFGIWGFFAVWILKGLQFFYTFIPNYGVSIILLTFLIRILTFPLQYKSFVSMKKLQVVQPELTKIREKYKNDPQKVQKESMELFRRTGANPIGGCLPMLLQMPVFFAFYKVLYSAVELVDAPFILWLHDLSNKDPYYVLPVLMTGAMFLQQRLTPNTISDPVQKKVMMFMPLLFGVFMKDLPSGLSLYIFVSTLFGIVQQSIVFKSKTSNTPVVV
jgi:YidC/Oxa1 family membrane protein insertase